MTASANESAFQNDIIREMEKGGWVLGSTDGYDRKRALYPEDCLAFVKQTQPKTWKKYCQLYPDPDTAFLDRLTTQLEKAEPNATAKHLRTFGTLGVLRHELRDRSCAFKLCQFKPDHSLNPDTLAAYKQNILRLVPELTYSPYATQAQLMETGRKAKRWRIDLVLFVNGIPVVTMELKSEFKQTIDEAKKQYKTTRLPKDPQTNKPEPLLTFKRGALVHFAVSQFEAWMTTRLAGNETHFLPFNKGTADGGAGNDVPADPNRYATDYLWNEVLHPDNLLNIIGRFIHLEIKETEDWQGRKSKKETLIFPRYHQWDLVYNLINTTRSEGSGHKYLVQHSAGSGKSNSIAWTAHQLASLYDKQGNKLFRSVIVVTDRNVLDSQLQDTIYQFEHKEGVICKINRDEGQGAKSAKLATALTQGTNIVIVTIQTFPYVLEAIENSVSLKAHCYAIIADEAHSSQTGIAANKLKEVLRKDDESDDLPRSAEDMLAASVEARRNTTNLSYYAFTATPKAKTLELFGRVPNPDAPPSQDNKPHPFHIYSMRQAIEERYILDVLRNYTSYVVAYNLAQKAASADLKVDSKKARNKLSQWVKLHDHNIAQKVQVIVNHFHDKVAGLLGGQAKAMVVTGSRKEAVRYKLAFDDYVKNRAKTDRSFANLNALVAFSGEVEFAENDPNVDELLGETFTETSMNPGLKGRDMRKAFDTDDYHVMIVAQKFQTGFDQPKLCAMYVDKKLGGVECVQTLSRLNRIHEGKEETYVIDFYNKADEVLAAFKAYYQTATLNDVSDPNLIWALKDKLEAAQIFTMTEVTHFAEVFFAKSKSNAAITNVCKPAAERWQKRYQAASAEVTKQQDLYNRAKQSGDAVLIGNADNDLKAATTELDALGLFKADLASFTRLYEFLSQIIDYDSTDLEKLSLFARHLGPLLREWTPDEDPIDLSSVDLSHYRLSLLGQKDLMLTEDGHQGLEPGSAMGTGKPRSKEEEFLSQIIARLNALFITDNLTDDAMLNYTRTIRDKIGKNSIVIAQIQNNSAEQVMLGDFASALDDAVIECSEDHQNLMHQILGNPETAAGFGQIVFDPTFRTQCYKNLNYM
jgi:type I restriction enzyme R subunit